MQGRLGAKVPAAHCRWGLQPAPIRHKPLRASVPAHLQLPDAGQAAGDAVGGAAAGDLGERLNQRLETWGYVTDILCVV